MFLAYFIIALTSLLALAGWYFLIRSSFQTRAALKALSQKTGFRYSRLWAEVEGSIAECRFSLGHLRIRRAGGSMKEYTYLCAKIPGVYPKELSLKTAGMIGPTEVDFGEQDIQVRDSAFDERFLIGGRSSQVSRTVSDQRSQALSSESFPDGG